MKEQDLFTNDAIFLEKYCKSDSKEAITILFLYNLAKLEKEVKAKRKSAILMTNIVIIFALLIFFLNIGVIVYTIAKSVELTKAIIGGTILFSMLAYYRLKNIYRDRNEGYKSAQQKLDNYREGFTKTALHLNSDSATSGETLVMQFAPKVTSPADKATGHQQSGKHEKIELGFLRKAAAIFF